MNIVIIESSWEQGRTLRNKLREVFGGKMPRFVYMHTAMGMLLDLKRVRVIVMEYMVLPFVGATETIGVESFVPRLRRSGVRATIVLYTKVPKNLIPISLLEVENLHYCPKEESFENLLALLRNILSPLSK